jgi:outer membrane protein
MKHIHFIVEGVLAVAIVALFILNFSGKKADYKSVASASSSSAKAGVTIAYVNMDTLLAHYESYTDKSKEIQQKQKSAESELDARSRNYQKSLADYQYKAQKGLITRAEAQQIEQQLGQEQQNLLGLRDKLGSELSDTQVVMNRKLYDEIQQYLKEYNKDGRYTYILSNTFGGNLLFAADSLDITQEVLKGMNEKYAKNKK